MSTKERIIVTGTKFITATTGLTGQVRTDKNDRLPLHNSFVLDKALQLKETPAMQPSIKPFSPLNLSYSFKVFQYNRVSRSNNFLADFMIYPAHVTFLPATQLPKKSFSRLCAFTLQFSSQILELNNLSLIPCEKFTITANSEVVYSEVNTYNLVATRSRTVNLSRECDVKKHPSLLIFNDFEGLVSPVQILPVILGNVYRKVLSFALSESSEADFIRRKSEKISVKADRTRLHNRLLLEFGGFKIFRSFSDCFYSKIGGKPLSQTFINKMMQFKLITNLGLKSFVNSILNGFQEDFRHIQKWSATSSFNLYRGNELHNILEDKLIYKPYAQVSSDKLNEVMSQFPTASRMQCPLAT